MSADEIVSFAQLPLAAPILQAVGEAGYEAPSPIQAQSIPPLLEGRDLLGMAQTGTGKTAAFALPLLSRLDLSQSTPQILVLAPTRELALQVAEAMQSYARHLPGFHILPVYGGQSMDIQLRQLRRGVHVVVGTPGRVQDHLRRGTLNLDGLRAVVLDEADEMLRMGFIDDVEQILEHTPSERQVALFSATMPEAIRRVARAHLKDPVEIRIKAKTTTVSTITQRYWQVSGVHKLDALTRILEVEEFDGLIIFVRTKTATVELAEKLEARGYSSAALNGDMNQALREKTIERLKNGKLDIVVATDVAARGLDVERISHVINYDIPYDTEAYVHRIGRTGRAGRKGEAILFVAPREKRMLAAIEKATRQPITPMQLPSRADIAGRRTEQFRQLITDTIESQELGFFEEVIEGYQSEHNIGLAEIAAALAYLVQRERPLQAEPEPKPSVREGRPEGGRDKRREPRSFESAGEPEPGMQRYRLEVGRESGVQPKNIVGAIANEAGLESRYIGHIKLYDHYSTVDLPEGMPEEALVKLQQAWICGRQMRLHLLGEAPPRAGKRPARSSRPGMGDKPAKGEKAGRGEKPLKRKPGAAGERRASADAPVGKKPKKFIRSKGADSSRRKKG